MDYPICKLHTSHPTDEQLLQPTYPLLEVFAALASAEDKGEGEKCGYGRETVEHYLLECRKYKEQRKRLRKEVGMEKMKVGILLSDPTKIKHTMTFIKETGRLERLEK